MNDPPVPELGGYDPDRYDGWTLEEIIAGVARHDAPPVEAGVAGSL